VHFLIERDLNISTNRLPMKILSSKQTSKKELIKNLKKEGYLLDKRLEKALVNVDIETFIPKSSLEYFYKDKPVSFYREHPLPAPSMTAILIQSLELVEGDDVLLLGVDSGYISALISVVSSGHVYLIDSNKEICDFATAKLINSGYEKNVTIINRDPLEGIPINRKWSKILVLGQIPKIPPKLIKLLAPDGILLAPVGPESTSRDNYQEFTKVQLKKNEFTKTSLGGVLFVPLISKKIEHVQIDKDFSSPKTAMEEEFKSNPAIIEELYKFMKEYEETIKFKKRIATVRRCPLNLSECNMIDQIKQVYSENNIFVDIPYREDYLHFEQAICETIKKNGLNPVLAKDETKSDILLCKICRAVQRCNYGIADISYQSSNVLYELGMMHSLGMNVAILKNKNAKQPSDIHGKECIKYQNTDQLKVNLDKWIKDNIPIFL